MAWTLAVLILLLVLPLSAAFRELLEKTPDVPLQQHLVAALGTAGQHLSRALLPLAWLPHEVAYSLGALGRALWRMSISKEYRLQWQPSREAERGPR